MTSQTIQNVYVVGDDLDALAGFYEQALGLKTSFRDGERWCQFKLGTVNFAISSREEAPPGTQGAIVVFETTESLASTADQVRRAGGSLLDMRDMGSHGCVATFADPAAHVFQVFARAAI